MLVVDRFGILMAKLSLRGWVIGACSIWLGCSVIGSEGVPLDRVEE